MKTTIGFLVGAALAAQAALSAPLLRQGEPVAADTMGSMAMLGTNTTRQTLLFRVSSKNCLLIVRTAPGKEDNELVLTPSQMTCAGQAFDVSDKLRPAVVSMPSDAKTIMFTATDTVDQ